MIATRQPSRDAVVSRKLIAVVAVLCASLLAVEAADLLQWMAVGVAAFAGLAVLILYRPRYGLYAGVFLAVLLEPFKTDPFMHAGWLLESDISSSTPLNFAKASPLELILLITAFAVLGRAVVARSWPAGGTQFKRPLLIFLGLLLAAAVWGLARHGSFTIALWETRSLVAALLVAFLIPVLLPRREQVEQLVSLVILAVVLLSIEIIWRRFTLLADVKDLDLAFDHATPNLMNFVVVLLLARLIWPASRRQRLVALAIPLILYAEMLTERRAGWIGLDVGFILLTIFVFRLRRKVFYFLVLPLLIVYAGYLGAFWNAQGTIAEPARAVKSIVKPDARDAASNLYRQLEMADIRLNVRASPVLGLGFGHPYTFYIPLPDLSWWQFWHYESHNSLLWIWMEMGPLGFITFLTLLGAGIVRGVQLLRRASSNRSAPLLIAFVCAILMFAIYCFVDLGMFSFRSTLLLGLALGVVGAWGHTARACQEEP